MQIQIERRTDEQITKTRKRTHREKRLIDIQIMRRYRKGKRTDRKKRIMDKIGIERTLD